MPIRAVSQVVGEYQTVSDSIKSQLFISPESKREKAWVSRLSFCGHEPAG